MLDVSEQFKQAMVSPVRRFRAEVALQEDSENPGNLSVYTHEDRIKSIEIQRVGDNSKFFGFGVSQRLSLKMVDLADELYAVSKSSIKVKIGTELESGAVEWVAYPTFYLTETNRSEDEGEVTYTAYDSVDEFSSHLVTELSLALPYTVKGFIQACATLIGAELRFENIPDDDYNLNLSYTEGANFGGTETVREALDMAAEAIQAVYFIDGEERLRFKRLDVQGAAVATVTPEEYISFTHGDSRRLVRVAHVTELGDNVVTELGEVTGTTQYVRENAFWTLRDDITTIVDKATENVYRLTILQYECEWRGFPYLEIGDKIEFQQVGSEGRVSQAYVLDDVITYDGSYSQKTQWEYTNSDSETEANPTSIGDAVKQTSAKVDKVNRVIDIVSSNVEKNTEQISAIQLNTESINLSVQGVQKTVEEGLGGVREELKSLTESVSQTVTKEALTVEVERVLSEEGVSKVTTTTGTFDEQGLLISKSGSEMSTRVTEDGLTVLRDDVELLRASNYGVDATNLHATTYLIVGNSRFEDWENPDGKVRTACFWIGGE